MNDLIGAEFAVVFDVDRDYPVFTFGTEYFARTELCRILKIVNGTPEDRDDNGNLLVAFSTTREHLRDIHDRMNLSVSYGAFDARYLCVWPDPEGEMLTGEALRAWLEEDI